MTNSYAALHKRFDDKYGETDLKFKFTERHYRFFISNGRKYRSLPSHNGQYFLVMEKFFKSEISTLQKSIVDAKIARVKKANASNMSIKR